MTLHANGPDPPVAASAVSNQRGSLPCRWKVFLLTVVVVLPRLARLTWPEVWLEDVDYVHAGLLVSRGLVPFRDFPSPHFPLLEWILGAIYVVTGPSLRVAELLTQAAAAATSLLLYRAVSRYRGFAPGILVAALYGCSSLIFRYHLFEREIFTNLLLAGGLVLLSTERLTSRWRCLLLVALGGMAVLIKLTALLEWCAVIIFVLFSHQRRKEALLTGGGIILVVLVSATVGVTVFKDTFVSQVFLFHTLKGSVGSVGSNLRLLRQCLDVTGIFGFAGLVVLAAGPRFGAASCGRREMVLPSLLLLIPLLFFLFFSPTFWPHNMVPLLIPLSWLGSMFIVWMGGVIANLLRKVELTQAVRGVLGLGLIVLGCVIFPLRNDHWQRGSFFGFGFQARGEIRAVAEAVRGNSSPDDRVIAPASVAVEANRMKLIHYREVSGPMRVIERAVATGNLSQLRVRLRDAGFYGHLFESAELVGEEMVGAMVTHSVPVVVPDSRLSLQSETRVREAFLQQQGYRQVLATEHYSVWVVSTRERTSPTR